MQTLVVVQARSGSTRLPGKVLLPVAGAPLLVRMLERVRAAESRARQPFTTVVATTTDPADDPVVSLARDAGVVAFRGHPTDLLDRHVMAARAFGADRVVKIPSDCPLIDPDVIAQVLDAFDDAAAAGAPVDYASNLHPATWPDGHDVEVMAIEALERAHLEADRPHEREHTTPFLWDEPGRFRTLNVTSAEVDRSMTHRMTIDYPEDYAFVRAVYEALYTAARPIFSLDDVLALLAARPDIFQLNAMYAGVNWYRHHLADLKTVRPGDTRCPPV